MFGRGGGRPRRPDLSQHFLRSRGLASNLVAQAGIGSEDLVVEIGPGRGILTEHLARRCRRVVAVELDPYLAGRLRDRFQGASHVSIREGDFLRTPLPAAPYRVVGNIPFARTAAIVRRLVSGSRPPEDAYLVVQREAGERFAGRPSGRETRVSLGLKPWWHVEIVRRLRRRDFDPPPSVDAVCLWMLRRHRPLISSQEAEVYRSFLDTTFDRSGGSVGEALRQRFSRTQVVRLGRDLDFSPEARITELSFEHWLGVFRTFQVLSGEQHR